MRFGRRKRTAPPQTLRQKLTDSPDPMGSLRSDERSALMAHGALSTAPDLNAHANDPTQDLLMALGRFQRHVAKAESGADSTEWADPCMHQLISGVEIALNHNLTDMVEALTDTGRILQSFENAGCPEKCVPFLSESYEILCLMVGDLIVDNVNTAVMTKWRAHYGAAVEVLERAGIPLVNDDDVSEGAGADVPFDLPEDAVEDDVSEATSNLPELGADDPLPAEAQESAPAREDALPPLQAFGEVDYMPVDDKETEVAQAAAPSPPAAQPKSPPEAGMLDAYCTALAQLELAPPEERNESAAEFAEKITALERFAASRDKAVARQLTEELRNLLQHVVALPEMDEKFIEVAYGFCDAYAEALHDADADAIRVWVAESDELLGRIESLAPSNIVEFTPTAPAAKASRKVEDEAPEPEAEEQTVTLPTLEALTAEIEALEQASEETPESAPEAEAVSEGAVEAEAEVEAPPVPPDTSSLLATAAAAFAEGNVADAKFFALEAAVQMARAESERAENHLRGTEQRLQESKDAITTARESVKEREQRVLDATTAVSDGEQHLESASAKVAEIDSELADIDSEIQSLDEQIAALEAKREEERAKAETTRESLEAAREDAAKAKAALEESRRNEDTVRVHLEDARQQVTGLQQKRTEIEHGLEQARDAMSRKGKAVIDIEQTIAQLQGEDKKDGEELLF